MLLFSRLLFSMLTVILICMGKSYQSTYSLCNTYWTNMVQIWLSLCQIQVEPFHSKPQRLQGTMNVHVQNFSPVHLVHFETFYRIRKNLNCWQHYMKIQDHQSNYDSSSGHHEYLFQVMANAYKCCQDVSQKQKFQPLSGTEGKFMVLWSQKDLSSGDHDQNIKGNPFISCCDSSVWTIVVKRPTNMPPMTLACIDAKLLLLNLPKCILDRKVKETVVLCNYV